MPPTWTASLVFAWLLALPGAAPIRYTVTVDRAQKLFHVSMQLASGVGALRTAMPAATPGEVAVKNHARHIGHLVARAAEGQLLVTHRVDKQTWEVTVPRAQVVVIDYDVHVNEGDLLRLGTNWLTDSGGFFEGATLILYSPGRQGEPVTVDLRLPPSWRVATTLKLGGRGFEASDYRRLLDAPFQIGEFTERVVLAGALRCRLVFDAPLLAHDTLALDATVQRIIDSEWRFFGSAPFGEYLVLLHWRPDLEFGGGLEHGNAMVLNVGNGWMEDLAIDASGTLAHELFHAWNARAFYPRELGRWSYTGENYSRLLWFVEGVTSYYAHLTLVRSGVRSREAFLQSLSRQITAYEGEPGRGFESLSDAGVAAWAQPVDGTDYYSGGEVVGFLLDLEIRLATEGRRSLDDVMRALYRRSLQPGYDGYTQVELAHVAGEVAGRDLRAFFARYVDAMKSIDYAAVLGRAGLQASSSTDKSGRTSYSIGIKESPSRRQTRLLEGLFAGTPVRDSSSSKR